MGLAWRVLLGLGSGLVVGVLARARAPALAADAVVWLEPIGRLWVNALRMTVVPLVVGSIVAAVAGERAPSNVGRWGARVVVWFVGVVAAATVAGTLVGAVAARRWVVAAAGAVGAPAPAPRVGWSWGDWVSGLLPASWLQAAAEGAMIPLVLATLLFALALRRVEDGAAVVRFLETVAAAALELVRWVVLAAPVGVAVLGFGLAVRTGWATAGALAGYVAVVASGSVALAFVLTLLGARAARRPLCTWTAALLPAWAVAFASRSSLATLPTLIDALERRLGLPPAAPRFVLPVGASVFRPASGWMLPLGAWTLARLYGVPLGPSDALTLAILSALLSFGVPSIPGGSVLVAAPLLLAVGVPVDGLGLLLGVDALVDPFRTVANVTGHAAIAAVQARAADQEESGQHEHDPQAVGQRQMQELERHGRE